MTLAFPRAIAGPYRSVRAAARAPVRAIIDGARFGEAFEATGLADARDLPGWFVLQGPTGLLGEGAHVQCFVPLAVVFGAVVDERLPRGALDGAFADAVTSDWGLAALLAHPNMPFLYAPEAPATFLRALLAAWPLLDAAGERWSSGADAGTRLWWAARPTLTYALARIGVPVDALTQGDGTLDLTPFAGAIAGA